MDELPSFVLLNTDSYYKLFMHVCKFIPYVRFDSFDSFPLIGWCDFDSRVKSACKLSQLWERELVFVLLGVFYEFKSFHRLGRENLQEGLE